MVGLSRLTRSRKRLRWAARVRVVGAGAGAGASAGVVVVVGGKQSDVTTLSSSFLCAECLIAMPPKDADHVHPAMSLASPESPPAPANGPASAANHR